MIPLYTIAYARSGDKGNNANIGVIARKQSDYEIIKSRLTADKVKSLFSDVCRGKVERFELDNLGALNFLLYDTLGGGATVSLSTDPQGKVLAARLLSIKI